MTINWIGQEECVMDNGSMIILMARESTIKYGLNWDPALSISMESASSHVEKMLGVA